MLFFKWLGGGGGGGGGGAELRGVLFIRGLCLFEDDNYLELVMDNYLQEFTLTFMYGGRKRGIMLRDLWVP